MTLPPPLLSPSRRRLLSRSSVTLSPTPAACDLDLAAIEGNLLANKVLSSTAKVNVKVTLVLLDGDIEDVDLEDEDEWDDITATTPLSLEKEIAVEVVGCRVLMVLLRTPS
jgi:hypothetical protein